MPDLASIGRRRSRSKARKIGRATPRLVFYCGLPMLKTVTEEQIRVRYGETDQMGHAYYANYLYWFEQARGAWCRDRGFNYTDLEAIGYMLPVVEVYARYK